MIEINNLTGFKIDKKLFTGVAKKIVKSENRIIENVSIVFVSPAEIKKLNNKYRAKNKATDVLSFCTNLIRWSVKENHDIAEIVICPEIAKANAKKFKTTFKKELEKIFIHGLLHLLGYDHEKSEKQAKLMEQKEQYYLQKFLKQ